jgi:sugar lactone lactonase YvrE
MDRSRSILTVVSAGVLFLASLPSQLQAGVAPPQEMVLVTGMTGVKGLHDGVGIASQFRDPGAMAFDHSDTLYVVDAGNNAIRKISPDGTVRTLRVLKDEHLGEQDGIAVDAMGNVYVGVGQDDVILKITPNGTAAIYAGTRGLAKHRDGPAAQALFSAPAGLAIDDAGNLYVADSGNNAIREIAPNGTVSTFAGGHLGYRDGTLGVARFAGPWGVAVDRKRNLWIGECITVTDEGQAQPACALRRISHDGQVTTIAENAYRENADGDPDRPNDDAMIMDQPTGIAVDSKGCVYVPSMRNIETIDGCDSAPGTDTAGAEPALRPRNLTGIAIDSHDNVFVSDSLFDYILRNGHAFAGHAEVTDMALDQDMIAEMMIPEHAVADPSGNLYVEFEGNGYIRRVTLNGQLSERLNRVVDDGSIKHFLPASEGNWLFRHDDLQRGLGIDFNTLDVGSDHAFTIRANVSGKFSVDSHQNIYMIVPKARISSRTVGCSIAKISMDGRVSVLLSDDSCPWGLTTDGRDNVYALYNYESGRATTNARGPHQTRIYRVEPNETLSLIGETEMQQPVTAFAATPAGGIYLAEPTAILRRAADGTMKLVCGSETDGGFKDGTSSVARFAGINDLAVSTAGFVYVSESINHSVRQIGPDGSVTTVLSSSGKGTVHYDPKVLGPLNGIQGLAMLSTGYLVVLNNGTVIRTSMPLRAHP